MEELILIVLRGGESYGVPIHQAIEEATGGFVSIGSIYGTLDRLEQSEMISSREGESTPKRGGRAKKYFKIERGGQHALNKANQIRQKIERREITDVLTLALQGRGGNPPKWYRQLRADRRRL